MGGFCGYGKVCVGEWTKSHWIIGVISFPKIYVSCSVEHHKVEKWSYEVGCGWILWL